MVNAANVDFYAKHKSRIRRAGSRRFDPLAHPRAAAGRRDGGQFVEANGGTSPGPKAVANTDGRSRTTKDGYATLETPNESYPELLLAGAGLSSLALQLAVASVGQIEHRHHLFPREFRGIMEGIFQQSADEFNIDDFITRVDKLVAHQKVGRDVKGQLAEIGEAASRGGFWNSNLKLQVKSPAFQKLTTQQRRKAVLESILKASDDLGFDLKDLTKWGKDSVEDNAKSLAKFLKLCGEAEVDRIKYGKQMGKLVARCLETDVGRQMLQQQVPEIVERFVKGGIKGMLKNGARSALKKSVGPLSAFFIAMAMQDGDVEAAVADAAGIPPEAMDQLKAIVKGDANFDFGTMGLERVDSAGTLTVGQPAEVSIDGKAVGYAHVSKILDAGSGWYYVTITGEKDRFLQMKIQPSNTKTVPIPEGFPYFRYLPELQVPAPMIR